MRKFFPFLTGLILSLNGLSATIFHWLDSTHVLKCTLSSRHHNRIAVENRRIKKVIYPEGAISIRLEEETGQIFVQALVSGPPITTISIVTKDGLIQDIELNFSEKSAEILILQVAEEIEIQPALDLVSQNNQDKIFYIVNSLCNGQILPEYTSIDDCKSIFRVKKGVYLESVSRLLGCQDTLHIFSVYNRSRFKKCIRECDINVLEGDWVYLEKTEIKPGERVLAIISKGCLYESSL